MAPGICPTIQRASCALSMSTAPFGVVPRPANATSPQMTGWFRKKINSADDLKGLKIRIPGLGGKVYSKAGAAVVLVVCTANRQYDRPTALFTLLLLATSPFLLLVAGSFLSHVPALFFAVLALYAATRYAERPGWWWMAVIGVGLGLAFLTREIVAAFYGVSVVLVGVLRGFERRGRAALLDALVGGLVLAGAGENGAHGGRSCLSNPPAATGVACRWAPRHLATG